MFNLQTVNDMEGFNSTKGGFNGTILPKGSGGGGEGTDNYNDLNNKPKINGHTLSGDKTLAQLGAYEKPNGGIPKTDLDSDVQRTLNAIKAGKGRNIFNNVDVPAAQEDDDPVDKCWAGHSMDVTGVITSSSYYLSNFMEVIEGTEYVSDTALRKISFFDADKVFIRGTLISTEVLPGTHIRIVQNARYIRAVVFNSHTYSSIHVGQVNDDFIEDYVDDFPNDKSGYRLITQKDLLDMARIVKGVGVNLFNNVDVPAAQEDDDPITKCWAGHSFSGITSTYSLSNYMPVLPGLKYVADERLRKIRFYDKDMNYINGSEIEVDTLAGTFIANPDNSYYIRAMYYTNDGYTKIHFGNANDSINKDYNPTGGLREKISRRRIVTEDELAFSDRRNPVFVTSVGSSGFDAGAGANCITDEIKQRYNVTTGITPATVVAKILGYDYANVCAYSGHTASNIALKNRVSFITTKNAVTVPHDLSTTEFSWDLDNIECAMTAEPNWTTKGPAPSGIYYALGYYFGGNGGRESAGTIKFDFASYQPKPIPDSDFVIPAGTVMYYVPRNGVTSIPSTSWGIVRRYDVSGSEGLLLQIGANSEDATAEEILAYTEAHIKRSNCKWFLVFPKNVATTSDDISKAVPLLKKTYGANFFNHIPYMSRISMLAEEGLTPTTSDTYPDADGLNSNPLTAKQIAGGVPCDMQCIAEGRVPSSFWNYAYREDEDHADEGHFNAFGVEAFGKIICDYLLNCHLYGTENNTADIVFPFK